MTFEESDLRFEFDPQQWIFIDRYDTSRDFLNLRDAVPFTKAVDFAGIRSGNTLVLMEVKNFRDVRIVNKPRKEQGDDPLEIEFAKKVKDTIAGIAGGARNSTNLKEQWQAALKILASEHLKVDLILWLEEDFPPPSLPEKRRRRISNTFENNLKKGVEWLSSRVFLANRNNNPYPQSLSVTFLR